MNRGTLTGEESAIICPGKVTETERDGTKKVVVGSQEVFSEHCDPDILGTVPWKSVENLGVIFSENPLLFDVS